MGDIDIYPFPEFNNGISDIAQQPSAPVGPDIGDLWLDTDEAAGAGLSSILAYAEITSSSTSATAGNTVDVPGLEVTITVPAGRRLRITGKFIGYANTLPARVASTIREGAAVLGNFEAQPTQVGMGAGLHSEAIITPSAGTHTYKVSITAATNTGFVYVDSSLKGWLLVEDITGTLWPAGQSIGAGAIASEEWTAWVPTLTNMTLGNGTVFARYTRIGRTIIGTFRFTMGSTSAMGTDPQFTLPVPFSTLLPAFSRIGAVYMSDISTNINHGHVQTTGTNAAIMRIMTASGTYVGFSSITATIPYTWANTFILQADFIYEAAS